MRQISAGNQKNSLSHIFEIVDKIEPVELGDLFKETIDFGSVDMGIYYKEIGSTRSSELDAALKAFWSKCLPKTFNEDFQNYIATKQVPDYLQKCYDDEKHTLVLDLNDWIWSKYDGFKSRTLLGLFRCMDIDEPTRSKISLRLNNPQLCSKLFDELYGSTDAEHIRAVLKANNIADIQTGRVMEVSVAETVMDFVVDAFDWPFVDPFGTVDIFIKVVVAMAREFTPSKHFAPFSVLSQSSGSGKSRLIKEVAKRMFVFYICLRPSSGKSSGYPYRSDIADSFDSLINDSSLGATVNFPDRFRLTGQYIALITACLRRLEKFLMNNAEITPEKWYMLQLGEEEVNEGEVKRNRVNPRNAQDFWSKVRSQALGILSQYSVENETRFLESAVAQLTLTMRRLAYYMKKRGLNGLSEGSDQNRPLLPLLFVFDEASCLNRKPIDGQNGRRSYLNYLRVAFAHVPAGITHASLFAFFTDTQSKLDDFVPDVEIDTSFRWIRGRGTFKPFVTLPFWNLDLSKKRKPLLQYAVPKEAGVEFGKIELMKAAVEDAISQRLGGKAASSSKSNSAKGMHLSQFFPPCHR